MVFVTIFKNLSPIISIFRNSAEDIEIMLEHTEQFTLRYTSSLQWTCWCAHNNWETEYRTESITKPCKIQADAEGEDKY